MKIVFIFQICSCKILVFPHEKKNIESASSFQIYRVQFSDHCSNATKKPFHICGDFLGRLIEYGLIFSKRLNSFLFRSLFPFLFMSSHTLSRYHPDYTFCIVNSYSFLFLLSFSYNRPRSRRVPMESLGYRKTKVNGLTRFIFLLRIRSHIFHSVFAGYCSTNGTFLLRKSCVSRPNRPTFRSRQSPADRLLLLCGSAVLPELCRQR